MANFGIWHHRLSSFCLSNTCFNAEEMILTMRSTRLLVKIDNNCYTTWIYKVTQYLEWIDCFTWNLFFVMWSMGGGGSGGRGEWLIYVMPTFRVTLATPTWHLHINQSFGRDQDSSVICRVFYKAICRCYITYILQKFPAVIKTSKMSN